MIEDKDWSFKDIRNGDAERAARLEAAKSSGHLLKRITAQLKEELRESRVRFAIDSSHDDFADKRAVIQFQVTPDDYDWFFNARTGYRARFWESPETGLEFNRELMGSFKEVLGDAIPKILNVRRIQISDVCSREDRDMGTGHISREDFLKSLDIELSKIWICERLYGGEEVVQCGYAVLSAAERSPQKLVIPRWAKAKNEKSGQCGEGLRAPHPDVEYAWLDIKGGVLCASDGVVQPKDPKKRARHLHDLGWT
jgi:hypothetical protein